MIIDNDVAKGVQLENGDIKYADIVICNAGMFRIVSLICITYEFYLTPDIFLRFGICV